MKPAYSPTKVNQLRALRDNILVAEMSFEQRKLQSGIILINDNGTTAGIRPRWGRVYAIGPNQKDVKIGQWICVAHGRWTRGVDIEEEGETITIRKIDPKDILLVSDEKPSDDTLSEAVQVSKQSR